MAAMINAYMTPPFGQRWMSYPPLVVDQLGDFHGSTLFLQLRVDTEYGRCRTVQQVASREGEVPAVHQNGVDKAPNPGWHEQGCTGSNETYQCPLQFRISLRNSQLQKHV
jgi:hypothetical protein